MRNRVFEWQRLAQLGKQRETAWDIEEFAAEIAADYLNPIRNQMGREGSAELGLRADVGNLLQDLDIAIGIDRPGQVPEVRVLASSHGHGIMSVAVLVDRWPGDMAVRWALAQVLGYLLLRDPGAPEDVAAINATLRQGEVGADVTAFALGLLAPLPLVAKLLHRHFEAGDDLAGVRVRMEQHLGLPPGAFPAGYLACAARMAEHLWESPPEPEPEPLKGRVRHWEEEGLTGTPTFPEASRKLSALAREVEGAIEDIELLKELAEDAAWKAADPHLPGPPGGAVHHRTVEALVGRLSWLEPAEAAELIERIVSTYQEEEEGSD